jgi:hypothetical protein
MVHGPSAPVCQGPSMVEQQRARLPGSQGPGMVEQQGPGMVEQQGPSMAARVRDGQALRVDGTMTECAGRDIPTGPGSAAN